MTLSYLGISVAKNFVLRVARRRRLYVWPSAPCRPFRLFRWMTVGLRYYVDGREVRQ